MSDTPRLELENVSFSYGRDVQRALDSIDLALAPKRCLGLIGPNGAGKSTLLRLAAGLTRPSAGAIRIEGRPTTALGPLERGRLLAYVPQSFSLPFTFSVMEVVLQGRHPHMRGATFESRLDLDVARRAMDLTGIAHLGARPFDTLSGGERQRVLIAAALAQEPRLLILDEPTSSLDLRFQGSTVRLVRELVEDQEIAVLVALHDLNLASAMCDELALLVNGTLRAQGPPENVLKKEVLEQAYDTTLWVGQGPHGISVLPVIAGRSST